MRNWIAVATIAIVVSMGLMGMGCDKMPWSKSEPKAEPQQPAPPPAQEKPAAAPAEAAKPASGEPSQEVKAHLKQGMSYVSIAKNATSKSVFNENLDNAIAEFSNAITKDPNYAEAYSNRAVAYMLQKKNNKALDDLKKAKEIKPDSATIRYNLASVHSLMGNTDYGLDELDAALSKGFNDYDSLRKDPDINNLRKSKEFQKILEKHKVFITK
jgi:tetratricopeptide (TPR) repeat protein